ncbi:MAG: SixA phosphatase family protein [Planctomycetota bacterium]|jgi:phosphohistidine phosphatase
MTTQPEVWFLRHTEAAPATEPGGDAERPLTDRGRADAVSIGERLGASDLLPKRIVCSPLLRARTTTLAVLEGLTPAFKRHGDRAPDIEEDERLTPALNAEALVAEVLATGPLPALLVGHNPDMEELALFLTGEPVRFSKGTFARVAARGGAGALLEIQPGPRH